MKKSLYMTTALAAAGVLAFGATDVIAAEKAKKKAFYKSISNKGEPTNENLKNYIMATVKDENIEKVLGNYLPKYIESNRN